jgi:hypothetical protein
VNDLPTFHSRFGGLWIDRSDWRQEMTRRHLDDEQRALLEKFVLDGYVILEGAASSALVDAFETRMSVAFRQGNPDLLYQSHVDPQSHPMITGVDGLLTRVVDAFVPLPEALDLFAAPRLLSFLQCIFEDDPLLFQSLSFNQGSQQPLHQDTAYVVVEKPLQLAACWIALEDVVEGSGELIYAPGTHRLPDWPFGGDKKHWNPQLDGMETHGQWSFHLDQQARNGRGVERFIARKGDILIWHADLAHGGSPIANPALTRKSLVGHFCPQSVSPYYFSMAPSHATVRHHGSLAYASQHFRFADMPPVEQQAVPKRNANAAQSLLSLAQIYAKRKLMRSA